MSLPACEQRVLNQMEGALRASEPHLTSMYTIFTRLNVGEPVGAERLVRKRLGSLQQGTALYAIVLIPVMFVAIIVGALLGSGARSATACDAGYSVGGVSPLASRPSCQVSGKTVKVAMRKTISATARLACPVQAALFTVPARADQEFPPAAPVETATAGPPAVC